MADDTLETERLILRPPVAEDLPWVLAHMNTASVMRHLAGVRSPEAVAESLADDIDAFHKGGHQRWTAVHLTRPEHVRDPDSPRQPGQGRSLAPKSGRRDLAVAGHLHEGVAASRQAAFVVLSEVVCCARGSGRCLVFDGGHEDEYRFDRKHTDHALPATDHRAGVGAPIRGGACLRHPPVLGH